MKFQQGDVIKPLPKNPYTVTTGDTEWIVIESWGGRIRVVRNSPKIKDTIKYAKECLRKYTNGNLSGGYAVNAKDFELLNWSRTNKSLKNLLKENEEDLVEKKKPISESMWDIPF